MSGSSPTRYQQYKEDTVQISTWLAQTALSYGFALRSAKPAPRSLDPERVGLTPEQIKAEKVKRKKERRKARENGDSGVQDLPVVEDLGPGAGDYLLSLPEFVDIAKHLVQQHVEVPLAFMRLVARCVRARTQTMKGFLDVSDARESNDSHMHFIGVLQEVMTVLAPCVLREAKDSSATEPDRDATRLENRFAELLVEDGEEEGEEEDITLPAPTGPANIPTTTRRHFAPQATHFDAITNTYAFLIEVVHFRHEIRDIWTSYRKGKIDLVVASVATNTSLEILGRLHDDVVENDQPLFSNNAFQLMHAILACLVVRDDGPFKGFTPRQFYDFKLTKADGELAQVYDLSLVPYHQMLEYLEEIAEADLTPSADFDVECAYEPDLHRTKPHASLVEQWQNANIVITDAYYHYALVVQSSEHLAEDKHQAGHFTALDAMAKEMEALFKRQKVSLLGCAHAAIYSDINMTLGSKTRRAYAEFRRECLTMGWAARKQVAHDENGWGIPEADGERDKELQSLTELLIFYGTRNPVEAFRQHMETPSGPKKLSYQDQFVQNGGNTFMDRSPMFCGVLLLHFRLWFRRLGLSISNTQWKTVPMATLWKACKIHGKREDATQLESWPELEALGEIHGEANMFGGTVPTTLTECQIGLLTAKGAPPEAIGMVKHQYSDGAKPNYLQSTKKKGVEFEWEGHKGVFFQCKTPKPLKETRTVIPTLAIKYLDHYRRRDVALDLDALREQLAHQPEESIAVEIDNTRSFGATVADFAGEDNDTIDDEEIGQGAADNADEWEDVNDKRPLPPSKSPYTPLSVLCVVSAAYQQERAQLYTDYLSLNVDSIGILWAVYDALPDYFGHWPKMVEQSLPDLVEKILDYASESEKAGTTDGVSSLALKQQAVSWDIMEKSVKAINDLLKDIKEEEKKRVEMREDRCKELDGPKVIKRFRPDGTGLKAQRDRMRRITKLLR